MNKTSDSPIDDKLNEEASVGASSGAPGDFPEVMTIAEASKYLRIAEQVLYRHVRAGVVPASRVGGTIRFKKSVLDRWLEESAWKSVGAEPPVKPSTSLHSFGAIDLAALDRPDAPQAAKPRTYRRHRPQFRIDED